MRAPTHWLQSVDGSHSKKRQINQKKKKKMNRRETSCSVFSPTIKEEDSKILNPVFVTATASVWLQVGIDSRC